jgi:hypothetical protein
MKLLSDLEIRRKGLSVLWKELGEIDTIRFVSQMIAEQRDYLQFQETLFKDMTLDEIYEKAKAYQAQKQPVS